MSEPASVSVSVETTRNEKTCSRCHRIKPLGDFYPNKKARDGKQSWCKPCMRRYQKTKGDFEAPLDLRGIAHLLHRRPDQMRTEAKRWVSGDEKERDQLAAYIFHIVTTTPTNLMQVANGLGLGYRTVLKCYARARDKFQTEPLSLVREYLSARLEELADRALEDKQLPEARKAIMDMARLNGLVSTGGNAPTNVQVGVNVQQQAPETNDSAMKYLENRQKELDAQKAELEAGVVEGEIVE